jgi:hypothetical protein
LATIEAGRTAMTSLRKTFDLWIAVGRAVETLALKAERIGGRQTFKRLMAQNGFKIDGPATERQLDKSIISKLLRIMENLTEVQAWHEGLSDRQKIDYASPSTVFKHCPLFAKDKVKAEPKLTEKELLKQSVAKLEEENHKLKQQKEDERFTPTDTSENVAKTVVGMFTPRKAEQVARHILALLKERAAAKTDVVKVKAGMES